MCQSALPYTLIGTCFNHRTGSWEKYQAVILPGWRCHMSLVFMISLHLELIPAWTQPNVVAFSFHFEYRYQVTDCLSRKAQQRIYFWGNFHPSRGNLNCCPRCSENQVQTIFHSSNHRNSEHVQHILVCPKWSLNSKRVQVTEYCVLMAYFDAILFMGCIQMSGESLNVSIYF